jgi:hypothetical protein
LQLKRPFGGKAPKIEEIPVAEASAQRRFLKFRGEAGARRIYLEGKT